VCSFNKAKAFADWIWMGFLSWEDATYIMHWTIMMMTLEYPMAATTMTKPQWDFIMAPLLAAMLPRMGYIRTFPCDIVYMPPRIGVFHPWHDQHL
jgi:hypothetical protein